MCVGIPFGRNPSDWCGAAEEAVAVAVAAAARPQIHTDAQTGDLVGNPGLEDVPSKDTETPAAAPGTTSQSGANPESESNVRLPTAYVVQIQVNTSDAETLRRLQDTVETPALVSNLTYITNITTTTGEPSEKKC
ncbi:unnamed protein product [Merluccius merluccius]